MPWPGRRILISCGTTKDFPCFRAFRGAQIVCRVRAAIFQIAESKASRQPALQMLFSGKLPDFIAKLE